jgi:hypothetical protein
MIEWSCIADLSLGPAAEYMERARTGCHHRFRVKKRRFSRFGSDTSRFFNGTSSSKTRLIEKRQAMDPLICSANGHNGQLELTAHLLRILRQGPMADSSQLQPQAISLANIARVEFRDASPLRNGFLRIALREPPSGPVAPSMVSTDPQSVLFTYSQRDAFHAMKNALESHPNRRV